MKKLLLLSLLLIGCGKSKPMQTAAPVVKGQPIKIDLPASAYVNDPKNHCSLVNTIPESKQWDAVERKVEIEGTLRLYQCADLSNEISIREADGDDK